MLAGMHTTSTILPAEYVKDQRFIFYNLMLLHDGLSIDRALHAMQVCSISVM